MMDAAVMTVVWFGLAWLMAAVMVRSRRKR